MEQARRPVPRDDGATRPHQGRITMRIHRATTGSTWSALEGLWRHGTPH